MPLNGGELGGRRVLSRKTIELMTWNHLDKVSFRPGQGFGLGFYVVTDLGARWVPGSVGEYGWAGRITRRTGLIPRKSSSWSI